MANNYQDHAIMVICAADVDQIWHNATTDNLADLGANPTLPAPGDPTKTGVGYVHSGNFTALGQLRGDDIYLASIDPVYYGLVLKAKAAVGPVGAGDYLVVMRGTMDKLEWLNDASALVMVDMDDKAQGQVGQGFIQIYRSMYFATMDGAPKGSVSDNLRTLFNDGSGAKVFVCGHSLGAALSTYVTYDLTQSIENAEDRLNAYYFASPRTGTGDWVNFYQNAVPAYELVNYALDFVPMVPPDGQPLNPGGPTHNVHVIPARSLGALDTGGLAPFDAAANHSPIGYARMLDGSNMVATQILAFDAAQPAPPLISI